MDSSTVQEKLLELRKQYVAQLGNKVEHLQSLWQEILDASGNLQVSPEFQRLFHNMRGTAGTYGCPEVGEIATEIENLLVRHGGNAQPLGAAEQIKITDLMHGLAAVAKLGAERGAENLNTPSPFWEISSTQPKTKPLLYIVDDDPEFCRVSSERLKSYAEVETFRSEIDFLRAIAQRLPDAVIMDMILPEGELAGAHAAVELTSRHNVPVIFVSTRSDEESRLAAIRAGAAGYFIKQDDPARMIALLEQIITRTPTHPYSVLLIDDDVELSSLYQLKLQSAGIDAKVMHSPVGAIATIEAFKPEIILLDISMPDINGLELGALIRQYPAYNHIPIIYLTAASGDDVQLAAMRLGGDDLLHKPINADYLTKLLLARLVRVRVTRQGEHRLQQALSELSYIQKGLDQHAIVSIADLAGRITYVNDKFTEITGYSREETIGQNHRIVKSGLHPPEFYKALWASLVSGKMWNGEITNRRKNGELYTVLSTIIPILDSDGLPQRYLSVRTDITRLRQLNDELGKERERLALALEATHTGIWEWNINSNETHYDKNWCQLLGYPYPSQLSWALQIHPEDHPDVYSKMHALIFNQIDHYQSEHRKLNAAGGWDWVIESGRVVAADKEGNPLRVMGTMQLINDRKKIEAKSRELQEQLNQAIKMEAVGHLTAGIAHDFNNILGAMLGYVELSQNLLGNDQDNAREKLKRYLGMVMSSGSRAKELIAQMLSFSRLSPESRTGEIPIVLLTPVIKEVVSLLRSSIPSTIDLNYRLARENLKARVQPVHLHQIILNLGINARDAINELGKIDISLSEYYCTDQICSSCSSTFSGDYARITVQDSGRGIPQRVLDKIFDPFFTTKEVGKGTGMGLSVVHGLVHALGGHVQVQTGADSGTAISVLLPLETLSAAATQPLAGNLQLRHLKGAKIMVVDDEQAMATMLHEFLSVYGVQVDSYTDPRRALDAFRHYAEHIDLVITDETMPGMTGMHLAEAMLKLKPGLPIILCTGFSENASPEAAAKAGLAGFLNKPLKMNELLQKIEEQLQKNKS